MKLKLAILSLLISTSAFAAGPPMEPTQFSRAAAVVKSDTATIGVTSALYVGTTGDVKVDMANGSTAIVFKAVPGGAVLQIRVTRVYSTGTTAADIVALRN